MNLNTQDRAILSLGTSDLPIYEMVARLLAERKTSHVILDVGCGRGQLRPLVQARFSRYIGADVVQHEGLPEEVEFHRVDLDTGRVPLPDGVADVVVAIETIEHLENPRAFARELTRLTRAGGWCVITTPNQLSLLAKLGLVIRNEFPAFRGLNYPAHLTALLAIDLYRIAVECGWSEIAFAYSGKGRIPGTSRSWPRWLSRLFPRSFSDNIAIVGRTPISAPLSNPEAS